MSGHTVTLLPSGVHRQFPTGTLLSDALLDMGVAVRTPCGSRGTCGKCRVRVEGPPGEVPACRTPVDRDLSVHAEPGAPDPGVRLPSLGPDSRIGAAVDIGTTTVKIALADIGRGTSFEVSSLLNPQRRYGHDVISRIAAAADPAVRTSMAGLIRRAVKLSLENALAGAGRTMDDIMAAAFSGNTTMLYLLLGMDTAPLGRYPYTAKTRDFPGLQPESAGFRPDCRTEVTALPVLSAFIGGDLVGSLALCHDAGRTENTFFIDLGTNGELFCLDGSGRIFATSCAMGPALEGMNISWGMTADDGAITHIRETPDGLGYDMIGSGEPAGITGTAVVDLLGVLLDRGIVNPNGAFSPGLETMALPAPLRPARDGDSRALGLWGPVMLTQKDIRNVQLAKAAALAASRFILDAAGSRPEDIRHVYIAGALGGHADMGGLRRLGFLPAFPDASFEYLGNTSLQAAVQACLDPGFLRRAAALRDRTHEVVLSERKGFQDVFLESVNFPRG
ncbi:MAG TPA: ASKHA domain-containing protein [Deltaproteobacteria bacterium]|nr:ASKHA domain-containing protein [Deltaproteobacteria bacterium]